jgi:hypothetical protein
MRTPLARGALLIVIFAAATGVGFVFGSRSVDAPSPPSTSRAPVDVAGLTAFGAPVTCASADRPGVLTCERAVAHVVASRGVQGDPSSALASLERVKVWPTGRRVLAWVIRWDDALMFGHGPAGAPHCLIGRWAVVLDARTGRALEEGGTGTRVCSGPAAERPGRAR